MTVDLRSDTVTRPTPEMYAAMASAEVGDDVLGDDPTVRRLEELGAATTGHEAGLFVPSGTMGNQIALATWMRPGDAMLADEDAHVVFYEGGGPAVHARALVRPVRASHGVVDPQDFESKILARSEHTPPTRLLVIENTHNRAGGTVVPLAVLAECREVADRRGVIIHMDGARVFNAAVSLGAPIAEVTKNVHSVNFCLSKGLCAPVGSLLCGPAEFIAEARFWRKRMGGGMRQSGLLAACGIVSLESMVARLEDDHLRAQRLAAGINSLTGLTANTPETNIVVIATEQPADEWVAKLGAAGVRCLAFGPHAVRLVTHRDVDDRGIDYAVATFAALAG